VGSNPTSTATDQYECQVLEHLGIGLSEDEDLDQVLAVGDLSIFVDLGIDEMDLMIAGDLGVLPKESLAITARSPGGHPIVVGRPNQA
jgi:hypothetical protein